jgi:pectinesterase
MVDRVAYYNCSFVSIQDTLSDLTGRHFFSNCVIQGTIDFIFGYNKSLFHDGVGKIPY